MEMNGNEVPVFLLQAGHYAGAPSTSTPGGAEPPTSKRDPDLATTTTTTTAIPKLSGLASSGSGYRDKPSTLDNKHVDKSQSYSSISNISPGYATISTSQSGATTATGGVIVSPSSGVGLAGVGSTMPFATKVTSAGAVLSPDISPSYELSRGAMRSGGVEKYSGSIDARTGELQEGRRLSGVAAPPLVELQARVDRLASNTLRGPSATTTTASTSSTVSRRSSSAALPSEIFPHNLNTSRESCV
ncbi:hypothetical protein Pcinc_040559 [Petrolisthes cinctipes]|uniref:Uncharacterized protein n=1 Tax=Petrolisthes cinctipes TaxID=88211 RepID=A0AAE1EKP1_PETCI|nr:hypothetical protein Pcinc_040559 [Petrolisthes cinctipes]